MQLLLNKFSDKIKSDKTFISQYQMFLFDDEVTDSLAEIIHKKCPDLDDINWAKSVDQDTSIFEWANFKLILNDSDELLLKVSADYDLARYQNDSDYYQVQLTLSGRCHYADRRK